MKRTAVLLALLGVVALLAGCSSAEPAHRTETSSLAVATPALRALKQRAGVVDCVTGTAAVGHRADALPDITLPCLGGGPSVNLARLRGPLVVNLFASWCGPCRAELPYYQQLYRKSQGRIAVLGIDFLDPSPAQALRLVQDTGVTYPLLADPAGDLKAMFHMRGRSGAVTIQGLPGVAFVGAHGRVTDIELRSVASYAQLRGLVRRHLGVRLPA